MALQARLSDGDSFSGFGGITREAAASFCGQKFGVTSPHFQPCITHYTSGAPGDYTGGTTMPNPSMPTIPIVPPLLPGFPGQAPGTVVTGTFPTAGFFAPGWYTTLPGIIGIAAVGFIGYKLYTRSKSA